VGLLRAGRPVLQREPRADEGGGDEGEEDGHA
jgi:hypothetical protein